VVSDKKIFTNWILKKPVLTLWPTYATNWNIVNNFGRGQPSVPFHKFGNKRAQRALGRSPEDKVEGHSEAIYRGPLMLSTKYW